MAADEASTSNIDGNSEPMRAVFPIACRSLEEPGGISSLGSRWHCMPASRFRMLQRWHLLGKRGSSRKSAESLVSFGWFHKGHIPGESLLQKLMLPYLLR